MNIIKQETRAGCCSYTELLAKQEARRQQTDSAAAEAAARPPAIAPATLFVSHSWAAPFLDLVAALEANLARGAEEAWNAGGVGGEEAVAPGSESSAVRPSTSGGSDEYIWRAFESSAPVAARLHTARSCAVSEDSLNGDLQLF